LKGKAGLEDARKEQYEEDLRELQKVGRPFPLGGLITGGNATTLLRTCQWGILGKDGKKCKSKGGGKLITETPVQP